VVSPWSKGGFVCSEVLDHTSIIRFMETRFGVKEPNISPWRRAVCGISPRRSGVRQARPLPYDLDAAATVDAGVLTVTFTNRGTAGAVFHTRARTAGSSTGMRAKTFTVEAGRQLRATFAVSGAAGYDVEVHGRVRPPAPRHREDPLGRTHGVRHHR
jgi:phospholipase C